MRVQQPLHLRHRRLRRLGVTGVAGAAQVGKRVDDRNMLGHEPADQVD